MYRVISHADINIKEYRAVSVYCKIFTTCGKEQQKRVVTYDDDKRIQKAEPQTADGNAGRAGKANRIAQRTA
jgi:hypothetical protein